MLWLVLLCAATCGTSAWPPDDVSWLALPALQPAQDTAAHKTSYTERLIDGWHSRPRNTTRRPPNTNTDDNNNNNSPPDSDSDYPNDLDLVSSFLANNIADLRRPPNTVELDHKTWPGDSGVESLDDLILYHTYTSGERPDFRPGSLTPQPTNQKPALQHTAGGTVGFIKQPVNTHSSWESASIKPQRPNVILVEDVRPPYLDPWPTHRPYRPHPPAPVTPFTLLTQRPFVEYTTRPPPSQEPPQIVIINHYPTADPTTARPHYSTKKPRPATTTTNPYPPPYLEDFATTTYKPHYRPPYPGDFTTTTHKPHYPLPTEVSTYKPAHDGPKCPNITITSTINNYNSHNSSKEGCGDVNIVINNANQLIKDASTEAPSTEVQGDPFPPQGDPVDEFPEEEPTPPGGIVGMMTPVIDAMNNLTPVMSVLAAPLILFLAFGLGVTGLIFPWALSSALWRRSHDKGKGVVSHHYWVHKGKGHGGWTRGKITRPHDHTDDQVYERERPRTAGFMQRQDSDSDTSAGVGGHFMKRVGVDRNYDQEFLDQLEEFVRGLMVAFDSATRNETH